MKKQLMYLIISPHIGELESHLFGHVIEFVVQ
ncbi:MAG: hypothetical protein UV69_C0018G0002 [Parcubacteria group bacterium GW2011_GWE2_43_12]|nr:MAG: hypothetical protein UV69_C0018G0002 [Parcubacteria group bacterium GW2011_GWE2_43_12]